MASGSAHPPGSLHRVIPGRAMFPPLPHDGTPRPALFPARPLPAAGTTALCLCVPQPAAGHGPSEGLLNTLEISGRAETSPSRWCAQAPRRERPGSWAGGNRRHGWAFPISLWFPPGSVKANGRVNSILKYRLRLLARMQKDARKQGFG